MNQFIFFESGLCNFCCSKSLYMEVIKTMVQTDGAISGLLIRLTLALVILPHGCQQLFGWFGGYGFNGTMQYYTGTEKLPWLVGLLVILLQSVGALLLLCGAGTRLMALAFIGLFIGMIVKSHLNYGFFMNWSGQQKGEGYEYHLLVIGMALVLLINGAGRYSVDGWLFSKS